MPLLDRDEYVEQAYFFRVLSERLPQNMPLQELLGQLRDEVLSTTKLPMALDFLLGELKHRGEIHCGMRKLAHYFTAFQTYVVSEGEDDRGRFDLRVAFEILWGEVEYRAAGAVARRDHVPIRGSLSEPAPVRKRLGCDGPGSDLDTIGASGWKRFVDKWESWTWRIWSTWPATLRQRADPQARRTGHQRADPVRREGGENCPGQSAKGPAVPVCRPAASSRLPARPTSQTGGRNSAAYSPAVAAHGTARNADEAGGGRTTGWDRSHAILRSARANA